MNSKLLATVACLTMITATAVQAQSVANIYKGKTLSLVTGGSTGGAHDAYARLLARHLGKHIPGNPNIIVQNKPGAGGVVAINWLANKAKNDGLTIGATYPGAVIEPLLEKGKKKTQYDPRKLPWIGNIDSLQTICFSWHTSPVKTLAQAKQQQVIVGASSPQSGSGILPKVMNQLIGTKFKVVYGYRSSRMRLALESGEISAICGYAYSTIMASTPDWITKKKINILAQDGMKNIPALKNIPRLSEFAGNAADKKVFRMLVLRSSMGRPFIAPPGTPKPVVAALRDAFAKTMKDPGYLKDAKLAKQSVNFMDHKGMMALINEAYAMPKDIIKKVSQLTHPPRKKKKKK